MIWKRIFDTISAFCGLLILAPLLILISLCIAVFDRGPIIFSQVRIGKNGTPFKIYKFRTMVPNAESMGVQVTSKEDNRITKTGRFLRKYKLDELPQLLNVLKGDMSIVGPRPEVPKYIEFYTNNERKIIHSIRPGITDPASIKFSNENELLSDTNNPEKTYIEKILPQKIELYIDYAKHRNFLQDIQIVVKTLFRIL